MRSRPAALRLGDRTEHGYRVSQHRSRAPCSSWITEDGMFVLFRRCTRSPAAEQRLWSVPKQKNNWFATVLLKPSERIYTGEWIHMGLDGRTNVVVLRTAPAGSHRTQDPRMIRVGAVWSFGGTDQEVKSPIRVRCCFFSSVLLSKIKRRALSLTAPPPAKRITGDWPPVPRPSKDQDMIW
jgi:hypothetical protein